MSEFNKNDFFNKVKELLNSPEKWTKFNFALTSNGEKTQPVDKDACCFCLIGAIQSIAGREYDSLEFYGLTIYGLTNSIISKSIRNLYPERVNAASITDDITATFNDHEDTTFEDIHKVLDEVINR